MAYMEEITDYKNKIFQLLWDSESIKSLISNQSPSNMTLQEFKQHVIPYGKNIETVVEETTFIFFDVNPTKAKSTTVMDYTIYFWIMSHDNLNLTPKGVRVDLLTKEIDAILNGSRDFGIGMLDSGGAPPFSTAKGFAGRTAIYYSKDFNQRGGKRAY